MTQLNQDNVELLATLNDKLIEVEKSIYNIALEHNKIAIEKILKKEFNVLDYEIEVNFLIYGKEHIKDDEENQYLLSDWTVNIKPIMMKEKWWGINDNNCHNTTSALQKNSELNSQKHCWLLHSLYDHNSLDWDDIFKIDSVCFDIKIQYEYAIDITI